MIDNIIEFIENHMFQPDYYQFYTLILIGFIYIEIRIMRKINKILESREK